MSSRLTTAYWFESNYLRYAVCPGGEGAALKTVGRKRLARSNRVYGAYQIEDVDVGAE